MDLNVSFTTSFDGGWSRVSYFLDACFVTVDLSVLPSP
jgi:hypothetical protein